MPHGRIVSVRSAGLIRVFDVGLEQEHLAIQAVKIVHPELASYDMQAAEKLSPTAVAYLDLFSGEVRERHSGFIQSLDSSESASACR